MANSDETSKAKAVTRISRSTEIDNAVVKLTPDDRLRVEFRIEDLVKKLIPGGSAASHCGGCNGCSGCNM